MTDSKRRKKSHLALPAFASAKGGTKQQPTRVEVGRYERPSLSHRGEESHGLEGSPLHALNLEVTPTLPIHTTAFAVRKSRSPGKIHHIVRKILVPMGGKSSGRSSYFDYYDGSDFPEGLDAEEALSDVPRLRDVDVEQFQISTPVGGVNNSTDSLPLGCVSVSNSRHCSEEEGASSNSASCGSSRHPLSSNLSRHKSDNALLPQALTRFRWVPPTAYQPVTGTGCTGSYPQKLKMPPVQLHPFVMAAVGRYQRATKMAMRRQQQQLPNYTRMYPVPYGEYAVSGYESSPQTAMSPVEFNVTRNGDCVKTVDSFYGPIGVAGRAAATIRQQMLASGEVEHTDIQSIMSASWCDPTLLTNASHVSSPHERYLTDDFETALDGDFTLGSVCPSFMTQLNSQHAGKAPQPSWWHHTNYSTGIPKVPSSHQRRALPVSEQCQQDTPEHIISPSDDLQLWMKDEEVPPGDFHSDDDGSESYSGARPHHGGQPEKGSYNAPSGKGFLREACDNDEEQLLGREEVDEGSPSSTDSDSSIGRRQSGSFQSTSILRVTTAERYPSSMGDGMEYLDRHHNLPKAPSPSTKGPEDPSQPTGDGLYDSLFFIIGNQNEKEEMASMEAVFPTNPTGMNTEAFTDSETRGDRNRLAELKNNDSSRNSFAKTSRQLLADNDHAANHGEVLGLSEGECSCPSSVALKNSPFLPANSTAGIPATSPTTTDTMPRPRKDVNDQKPSADEKVPAMNFPPVCNLFNASVGCTPLTIRNQSPVIPKARGVGARQTPGNLASSAREHSAMSILPRKLSCSVSSLPSHPKSASSPVAKHLTSSDEGRPANSSNVALPTVSLPDLHGRNSGTKRK